MKNNNGLEIKIHISITKKMFDKFKKAFLANRKISLS